MAIKVMCKCGRALNAPDDAAGRHGKCPACGHRLLIAAQKDEVVLTEKSVNYPVGHTVDLGVVKCRHSQLKFSFEVDQNQNAFVEILATQSIRRSNQFVIARLDDAQYEELVRALQCVQDVVKRYRMGAKTANDCGFRLKVNTNSDRSRSILSAKKVFRPVIWRRY
jgi:DNA-directed RNA polymerase subunit RPC12/RpoP